MKIAISGISGGFGAFAAKKWGVGNEIVPVDLRKDIQENIIKIENCDLFLNHAYSNNTKQSILFVEIFERWKNLQKIIINFGSSAIHESGGFSPMYVANKKHLINISQTLNQLSPYKRVRVINFNPGTLENNTIFGSNYRKLKFEDLFKILEFIISINEEIEISDITIKSTTQLVKNQI